MKLKALLFSVICICLLGCVSLKPVVMNRQSTLVGYKYVYITPTAVLTSGTAGVYGKYGSAQSNSVNPSDIIAGIMLKNGYTRLSQIEPTLLDETIIVNYGESGRRSFFGGYTIEITIQILSANNHDVLCVCSAEGCGSTEADDIRIAVNRALEKVFQ